MSKMKEILEDILTMPYYKNYAAASGAVHNIAKHEDAVEDKFVKHGLSFFKKGGIKQNQRDAWLDGEDHSGIPDNSYISQPCGTHNSPDFILKIDGELHFIECKSAKEEKPMYNSGVPKEKYIYVFCSEKHNKTTLYFGGQVCPPEIYELIQTCIKEHRDLDKKHNKILKENKSLLTHYCRPMIQHVSSARYFSESIKNEREQGVLNAV